MSPSGEKCGGEGLRVGGGGVLPQQVAEKQGEEGADQLGVGNKEGR